MIWKGCVNYKLLKMTPIGPSKNFRPPPPIRGPKIFRPPHHPNLHARIRHLRVRHITPYVPCIFELTFTITDHFEPMWFQPPPPPADHMVHQNFLKNFPNGHILLLTRIQSLAHSIKVPWLLEKFICLSKKH